MTELPPTDAPVIVAAFLARYLADHHDRGVLSLEEYQDMFPGFDDVLEREYAQLLKEEDTGAVRHRGQAVEIRGERIGGYRILEELGRGGQGIVYLAEHEKLGRKVALKVLPLGLAPSAAARRRFAREAAAAARLEDPGICTVYEVGDEDGVAWIAMRYIEGLSLAQVLGRWRTGQTEADTLFVELTEQETSPDDERQEVRVWRAPDSRAIDRMVALMERCARVLHAAHEAGLVHRDIKPGNIMVKPDGDPVLLDFGLAQVDEAGPTLTRSGEVLGTPAYMSPEQIRARRGSIDRRTDVFSLGITLYECITGRRPFDAPTRELLYREILTGEPLAPRRRNRRISTDLETVVACALDKDRDRRYQTAQDLAEDLRRVVEGESVAAVPPGPVRRAVRWASRRPAAATLLCAALVLVVMSTVFGLHTAASNQRLSRTLKEKERAVLVGKSNELAARSWEVRRTDPELALQLSLEAARRHDGPPARSATYDALGRMETRRTLHDGKGKEKARLIDLDPSGRRIAVVAGAHLKYIDVATGAHGGFVRISKSVVVRDGIRMAYRGPLATSHHFSKSGDVAALVNMDTVTLVDPATGIEIKKLPHEFPVAVAEFSDDGKWLVTAEGPPFKPEETPDRQTAVRVWRTHDGKAVGELLHDAPFLAAGFRTPDGPDAPPHVVAAAIDGTLREWDPTTGSVLRTLPVTRLKDLLRSVTYFGFRSNGERTRREQWDTSGQATLVDNSNYLSIADPSGISFFSTTTGKMVFGSGPLGGGAIRSARENHGRLLGLPSGGMARYEVRDRGPVTVMSLSPILVGRSEWGGQTNIGPHSGMPRGAAILPRGTGFLEDVLAVFEESGTFDVYSLGDGELLRSVKLGQPLEGGDVCDDGSVVAALTKDGSVLTWTPGTSSVLPRVAAPISRAEAASVSEQRVVVEPRAGTAAFFLGRYSQAEDRDGIVSQSRDRVVFHRPDRRPVQIDVPLKSSVLNVAVSPDGNLAAIAAGNGDAIIVDLGTGEIMSRLEILERTKSPLVFSDDGRHLCGVSRNGAVAAWDAATGTEVLSLGTKVRPQGLHFGLDDQRLLVSAAGSWRAYTFPEGAAVADGEGYIRAIGLNGRAALAAPDHMTHWSNGRAVSLSVVDLRTGEVNRRLASKTPGTRWVAMSPVGSEVLAAAADGSILLFDGRGPKKRLRGHQGAISGLAFSRDGRRFASVGEDRRAILWSRDGTEIATVSLDGDPIDVAFEPAGQWWMVVTSNGATMLPMDSYQFASKLPARPFTDIERQRYGL